jgi:hypothetical protein
MAFFVFWGRKEAVTMRVEVTKYLNGAKLFRILKEERTFEVQAIVKGLIQTEAITLIQKWREDMNEIEGPPATR